MIRTGSEIKPKETGGHARAKMSLACTTYVNRQVHSVERKSIGLKFSKSRTRSAVQLAS